MPLSPFHPRMTLLTGPASASDLKREGRGLPPPRRRETGPPRTLSSRAQPYGLMKTLPPGRGWVGAGQGCSHLNVSLWQKLTFCKNKGNQGGVSSLESPAPLGGKVEAGGTRCLRGWAARWAPGGPPGTSWAAACGILCGRCVPCCLEACGPRGRPPRSLHWGFHSVQGHVPSQGLATMARVLVTSGGSGWAQPRRQGAG